jgi:hypothetical protein
MVLVCTSDDPAGQELHDVLQETNANTRVAVNFDAAARAAAPAMGRR